MRKAIGRIVRNLSVAVVACVVLCATPACMFSSSGRRIVDSRLKTGGAATTVRSGSPADSVERLAQIVITPAEVDFGETPLGGESRKVLTLSNATGYWVTVVQVTFDRACFLRSPGFSLPLTIPPQAEAALDVTFRPLARGECAGRLLVEVDSAAGRIRIVAVRGVGV